MYDRRVAAILGEDDSVDEEVVWKEISDGKQCLYPRLLFIITGITIVFLSEVLDIIWNFLMWDLL